MTVYERIDKILKEKNLSRRKLARLAGIPETTLASAFSRKPEHFPSKYVKSIAAVLDVPAVYLATGWEGLKDAKDRIPELLHNGTNDIGCDSFAEKYPDGTIEYYQATNNRTADLLEKKASSDAQKAFEVDQKENLIAIFNQLNFEGQSEAIKQVKLVAEVPRYRKE